jgi:hypothetical protein
MLSLNHDFREGLAHLEWDYLWKKSKISQESFKTTDLLPQISIQNHENPTDIRL